MATPLKRTASGDDRMVLRLESSQEAEETPAPSKRKKTALEKGKIACKSFKLHAERGLDLWVTNGIISKMKKAEFLSCVDLAGETIDRMESEKWHSTILKKVAERLRVLSQKHFALQYPDQVSAKEFRKQAGTLVDQYKDYIKKNEENITQTLRAHAEAIRKQEPVRLRSHQGPVFLKSESLLPEVPLNDRFKTLFQFCDLHQCLLKTTEVSDAIESMINNLWNQENGQLFSLTIGLEALDFGKKIIKLLGKGDFEYVERKKNFSNRVERFVKGVRLACLSASEMDVKKHYFKIDPRAEDYHFPVSTELGGPPYHDICVSTAWRIRDWMHRYQTQPIVHAIPQFATLIQKVRIWAEANLNGELLRLELEACAELSKALG